MAELGSDNKVPGTSRNLFDSIRCSAKTSLKAEALLPTQRRLSLCLLSSFTSGGILLRLASALLLIESKKAAWNRKLRLRHQYWKQPHPELFPQWPQPGNRVKSSLSHRQ